MKLYRYESIAALNHQVYKCQGTVQADVNGGVQHNMVLETGSHVMITEGYKGDRILSDQSIYLDPRSVNVLYVQHGHHVGKAFVIMDQTETHYHGVEFLEHLAGLENYTMIAKGCFQEQLPALV